MAISSDSGIAKITLTNFFGARTMMAYNDENVLEEGVFIPLEQNGLKKNPKGAVSCYAFVTKAQYPSYAGWTHYLKMKAHPTFLAKMDSLGMQLPYLGNFKNENYVVYKHEYKANYVKASDYGDKKE